MRGRYSTPQCGTSQWGQCYQSTAVLDTKWLGQINALLNMLRMLFIILVVAAGVFVFNRDASRLVLRPIERMLQKVRDVSENPLAVKQARAKTSPDGACPTDCACLLRQACQYLPWAQGIADIIIPHARPAAWLSKSVRGLCTMTLCMHALQGAKFSKELRDGEPQMETRILEASINKICSLLAVGFGDAGAEVRLVLHAADGNVTTLQHCLAHHHQAASLRQAPCMQTLTISHACSGHCGEHQERRRS